MMAKNEATLIATESDIVATVLPKERFSLIANMRITKGGITVFPSHKGTAIGIRNCAHTRQR
jgi:hypothetical protein